MARLRVIGAVVVASSALFSCTLLVDTDGLVGTPPSAAPDAATDAGVEDGKSGGDARSDAAPADPCALPGVLYCTRFDEPTSLAAFRNVTDPTTRIDVVSTAFFSAPASAAFTIDTSSNSSADATLGITVGNKVSRTAFRGRVRIDKREAVDGRLLAMRIGNGGSVFLDHKGSVDQSSGPKLGTVAAVADNTWVEIRMELDGRVTPPTVTVTIGDATPAKFTLSSGTWSPDEVTAIFGISETSTPGAGWLVRWDDVVIQQL